VQECHVCVVDDCVDEATVLCEGLRLNNYNAVAVHTGADALEACAENHFDLVLLDVWLPDISGFDVCKQLRQSPKTRNVGVVFVTVKGSAEDISLGYSLGALDYITKPYNLPMVMVRVDAAVRRIRELSKSMLDREDVFLDASYTDDLTGLRNRRYLLERLQEEIEKSHRYGYPLSCLAIDVDDVQALDDELGPVSLDDLLVEVGLTLRNSSRVCDIVARYDSTLFAAVLPHAPGQEALGYAQRLLDAVDGTTFSDPNFPTRAGLRIGVATCHDGRACQAESLLGEAMRGLFEAKSHPSRRVVARRVFPAA